MESQWSNFKVHSATNGSGIVWNGPHDSSFVNGFVFNNTNGTGIKTDGNAGGDMFSNVHVWGPHTDGWVFNKLAQATNCVAEGASGRNVIINAQRSIWTGNVYGTAAGSSANEIGVQVGVSGGSVISGYIVDVVAWQWMTSTNIPLNFVNDGGGLVRATVFKTSATSVRGGTMHPRSSVDIHCPDDSTQSIGYYPRIVMNNPSGGAIQVSNGTKDMYRLVTNGTDGLLQLPGQTSVRGYTDAYSTERWRIDGATGVGSFRNCVATGISAKSANYTLTAADSTVLATGGSGGITITLPASPVAGQTHTVKKVDAGVGVITVTPSSGTIDGAANDTISTQWSSVRYQSDSVNWFKT